MSSLMSPTSSPKQNGLLRRVRTISFPGTPARGVAVNDTPSSDNPEEPNTADSLIDSFRYMLSSFRGLFDGNDIDPAIANDLLTTTLDDSATHSQGVPFFTTSSPPNPAMVSSESLEFMNSEISLTDNLPVMTIIPDAGFRNWVRTISFLPDPAPLREYSEHDNLQSRPLHGNPTEEKTE